jgi:hypothetical protein
MAESSSDDQNVVRRFMDSDFEENVIRSFMRAWNCSRAAAISERVSQLDMRMKLYGEYRPFFSSSRNDVL